MEKTNIFKQPVVLLGLFIGGGIILAAAIAGWVILGIRNASDVISVTGSAKVEVIADQAKWTTQVVRTVRESALKAGYAQVASDTEKVKAFFAKEGILETELSVNPISMNEVYQQNVSAEKLYTLSQTFVVQSQDVQKIKKVSDRIADVINVGVIFSTLSLDYTYTKLPEVRVSLLADAIKDAKTRAGEITKTSGRRIGILKSASSGVVQVQSRNSNDVSDYGSYDTSQIEKQVTVTIKAVFSLK